MHELCPFCGGKPELIIFTEKEGSSIFNKFAQVKCSYCGATGKKILLRSDWDDGYDCESGDILATENNAWKVWDNRTNKEIKISRVIVSEGITYYDNDPFSKYEKAGNIIKNGFKSFFKNINPIIICPEKENENIYTKDFAKKNNIPIEFKPIQWSAYGNTAGHKRDKEIVESADCMLAFFDGKAKETKYLIEAMRKINKPVTIISFE